MKRIVSLFLGFVMVFSMASFSFAAENESSNDYKLVEEKLLMFEREINNIDFSNVNKKIDLGDGWYATIEAQDVKEAQGGMSLTRSNQAETLWKDYGNRRFTAKCKLFRLPISFYEVTLVNHYTLSEDGIVVRYGEAWVNSSGDAQGTAGAVIKIKDKAKKGESVSLSCLYTLNYSITGISNTKTYKFINNVKCSDIDKLEKQVKVVQSWEGEWK